MREPDSVLAIRSAAAKFVAAEIAPYADELDQPSPIPDAIYRKLAGAGYLGCTIPEEYGGSGLSFREYCAVLEEMSKGHSAAMLAVTMTAGPIAKSILQAAAEGPKRELLPKLCGGEIKIAFALSEPEAGSDPAAMQTRAVKASGGWRISGVKQWITWGADADYVQVIALTDPEKRARGGITAFLVPRGATGFSAARTDVSIGMDLLAELHFDDCFVPDTSVLGAVGDGFRLAMLSLDEGRLGIAAACHGAAQQALDLAINHAKLRRTFGAPLADRQAIQWMLADSALELEASRALFEKTLAAMERGEAITHLSSMCKLMASEMVGRVCDRAMQIHGAAGLVRSIGVERLYRQTRHYRIGEGASEIQRMIIARHLLR